MASAPSNRIGRTQPIRTQASLNRNTFSLQSGITQFVVALLFLFSAIALIHYGQKEDFRHPSFITSAIFFPLSMAMYTILTFSNQNTIQSNKKKPPPGPKEQWDYHPCMVYKNEQHKIYYNENGWNIESTASNDILEKIIATQLKCDPHKVKLNKESEGQYTLKIQKGLIQPGSNIKIIMYPAAIAQKGIYAEDKDEEKE